MRPNMFECAISKGLFARLSPSFGNVALSCLPSMHPSHIDENVWKWTLPRFKSFMELWSTYKYFTFKCSSWRCPSSCALPFINDCVKLAISALCMFEIFILNKFPLCSLIAFTCLSKPLTIHSIRLNSTHLTITCSLRANLLGTWIHEKTS